MTSTDGVGPLPAPVLRCPTVLVGLMRQPRREEAMSTETAFYARFDEVSSDEWARLEEVMAAEDLEGLSRFWSEDPGYSEDEKHSQFLAVVRHEPQRPLTLRQWVIRFRALIHLCQVSPRFVDEYLQSEVGEGFLVSLSELRNEVFGAEIGGGSGRRTMDLVSSFVLDIPAGELEAGDSANVGEVLGNLEILGDGDMAGLMRRVRLKVDGSPPESLALRSKVSEFCRSAADVYTWLYLLDPWGPGALEVIAAYWEETASTGHEEDWEDAGADSADHGSPSLADKVEAVMEQSVLEEYDAYASRYGLGLEEWEDWQQEVLAFLRKLQTAS